MQVRQQAGGEAPPAVQRRYPVAPLVGAAAVVFNDEGEVLLVRRGRPPRAGQWGVPGGLLEVGESLAAGAKREVAEECGVEIEIGGIAGIFEPITPDEAGRVEYHYVVVDFWAWLVGGTAAAADDASEAAWVAMDKLADYALAPDSYQVVIDAHRMWETARRA